ncbi:MAG TPA: hypothetical protein VF139_14390 [Candidatus Polarisedimenticolaceae bacterium]
MRVLPLFLPLSLAITIASPARATCDAPPLFAMDGPTCALSSMTVECGCSECLEWSPATGSAWYEVTRCEVDTGRCVSVGDTRSLNRSGYVDDEGRTVAPTIATRWCVAWDSPFPARARFYDYTVRGCRGDATGKVCSSVPSDPVRYAGSPYACFADGREVSCGVDASSLALPGDRDGDGVPDTLDNCAAADNMLQRDADRDGLGDACDAQPFGSSTAAAAAGGDAPEPNPCIPTAAEDDPDGDRVATVCDLCPDASDPSQVDGDGDDVGDACDADDGRVALHLPSRGRVAWDAERGVLAWNVYRGDLSVLVATGDYVQPPGSNPLAARSCALATNAWDDPVSPAAGSVAFYLVGGRPGGPANGLGTDSAGNPRSESGGCP